MGANIGAPTVQDWLGAHNPKIADMCDRIQGLADVFADIVEAISMHADEYQHDVADYRPEAIVTPDGKVVVDLNPPTF